MCDTYARVPGIYWCTYVCEVPAGKSTRHFFNQGFWLILLLLLLMYLCTALRTAAAQAFVYSTPHYQVLCMNIQGLAAGAVPGQ